MSLILHHHPWSRAAGVVWMLEELGQPYELRFVDMQAAEHRGPEHEARNRMKKVPVLEDGDTVVSEAAAIGVYLSDRYALGRLSPGLDDPDRGPYLRWCFFSPSVIEPAAMAHSSGWEYNPSSAGFGRYEDMLATLDGAVQRGPWLLGDRFTMADCILGGTVRWLLQFKMLEATDALTGYANRLGERDANRRATEINTRITRERQLERK